MNLIKPGRSGELKTFLICTFCKAEFEAIEKTLDPTKIKFQCLYCGAPEGVMRKAVNEPPTLNEDQRYLNK